LASQNLVQDFTGSSKKEAQRNEYQQFLHSLYTTA
jgi:hypothetical protein